MPYRLPQPPQNPLARILAGLVALLALAAAFFFGLVVLALAVGLGVLAWLALMLRVGWLRRQGRDPARDTARDGAGRAGTAVRQGEVLEADYEVVSRRDDP
jgi:hypothetical protein